MKWNAIKFAWLSMCFALFTDPNRLGNLTRTLPESLKIPDFALSLWHLLCTWTKSAHQAPTIKKMTILAVPHSVLPNLTKCSADFGGFGMLRVSQSEIMKNIPAPIAHCTLDETQCNILPAWFHYFFLLSRHVRYLVLKGDAWSRAKTRRMTQPCTPCRLSARSQTPVM